MGAATYQGQSGGLYGNGSNSRPPAHEAAGMALAQSVGPLSPSGSPDPTGKYVFLSIGMSNTTQEFSSFVPLGMMDPDKDPNLVIIDGAQGTISANLWADPNHPAWDVVNQRLANAGLTPAQVAVAWVKTAVGGPTGGFPQYAQQLKGYMVTMAQHLLDKFPNVKIAYHSSRIYAGYATGVSMLNPEPYAYESGFSIQWLITDQIGGAPELAFAGPSAQVPWLSWGPYLWADGLNPRCDGLIWECDEFTSDGTHPNQTGRVKVAQMLHDFVKTDTTARDWFLASP
jgi:hypothetical protein